MLMWIRTLFLLLLAGCGTFEKEQITNPANFTTDRNALYNSNFEIWQRGTQIEVGNQKLAYGPDRWYVSNQLGDDSIVKISRTEATKDGSRYAIMIQTVRAPSKNEGSKVELFQTLDRFDSAQFFNKRASAFVNVRALKNVSKIGIQFMTNSAEAKVNTEIGQEAIFDVSPESSTAVYLNDQEVGSRMTSEGVLGIRIRMVDVKAGSMYDRENGFIVEQATMSASPFAGKYSPKYASFSDELLNCLRFYEKSYPTDVPPETLTQEGAEVAIVGPPLRQLDNLNSIMNGPIVFQVRKRSKPEVTIYSTSEPVTKGHWSDFTENGSPRLVDLSFVSDRNFALGSRTTPGGHEASFQWVADAEL